MKKTFLLLLVLLPFFFPGPPALNASELYIITARDGSVIVARDYKFTDEYVEFTTENGLPGFIKRTEFVKIENMVGVQPGEETTGSGSEVERKQQLEDDWLLGVGIFVIFCAALLVYLAFRKRNAGQGDSGFSPGRKEMHPKTNGHLSFEYKKPLGKKAKWTIEVYNAYVEKGILYIEGICTTTGKQKRFRADRVSGPVTDLSRGQKAPMEQFFADRKKSEKS